MFASLKWIAPALAMAMVFSFAASLSGADEAKKETGSVAGVVKDHAGAAVAGAEVRLFNQMPKKEKPSADAATGQSVEQRQAETPAKPKPDKPIPLANAVTDSEGKFTMSDVPVGDYTVIARQKGAGNARQNVSVKAGEVASVELTFKPKKDAAKPVEK